MQTKDLYINLYEKFGENIEYLKKYLEYYEDDFKKSEETRGYSKSTLGINETLNDSLKGILNKYNVKLDSIAVDNDKLLAVTTDEKKFFINSDPSTTERSLIELGYEAKQEEVAEEKNPPQDNLDNPESKVKTEQGKDPSGDTVDKAEKKSNTPTSQESGKDKKKINKDNTSLYDINLNKEDIEEVSKQIVRNVDIQKLSKDITEKFGKSLGVPCNISLSWGNVLNESQIVNFRYKLNEAKFSVNKGSSKSISVNFTITGTKSGEDLSKVDEKALTELAKNINSLLSNSIIKKEKSTYKIKREVSLDKSKKDSKTSIIKYISIKPGDESKIKLQNKGNEIVGQVTFKLELTNAEANVVKNVARGVTKAVKKIGDIGQKLASISGSSDSSSNVL